MDRIADIGLVHARDVLENIIHGRAGETRDLTRSYYARNILRRLRRGWILDQWRAYRTNQQSFPLWQGCAMIAMFSEDRLELRDVDRMFEDLAREFLDISPVPTIDDSTVRERWHEQRRESGQSLDSSTTVPGSLSDESADNHHRVNQYSRNYERQIERIKRLIQFFTQDKGFHGNADRYYDPYNTFIDKVLVRKTGIPISLCIVFAELAERVGIQGVELMGFPQHFMIRYRPTTPPEEISSYSTESFTTASGIPVRSISPNSSTLGARPEPPTFYLDLFHLPFRLLSSQEFEDHFANLGLRQLPRIYRDLPTPPIEIFLRSLRNILVAVEQSGGAERIGSHHHTSLYSAMTQLLVLHPTEEWDFYVLWLRYLTTFWPEDMGLIRSAIEDLELIDHLRPRRHYSLHTSPLRPSTDSSSSSHESSQPHGAGGTSSHSSSRAYSKYTTSANQETIKILRAAIRELENADEEGNVGTIRRRRRPRTANSVEVTSWDGSQTQQAQGSSSSSSSATAASVDAESTLVSSSSPTNSDRPIQSRQDQDPHPGQTTIHSGGAGLSSSPSLPSPSSPPPPPPLSSSSSATLSPTSPFSRDGPRQRYQEPVYYVGEVFQHLLYGYTGAIYGYDTKCEAEETWIQSMNIDSCRYGRHQPFYNALLTDGSRRYVAQENIQVLFRERRSINQVQDSHGGSGSGSGSESLGMSSPSSGGGSNSARAMSNEQGEVVLPGADATTTTTISSSLSVVSETPAESIGGGSSSGSIPAAASPNPDEGSSSPNEATLADTATPAPSAAAAAATDPSTTSSSAPFALQLSELGPLGIEPVGQYFEAWDGDRGVYVMNKELKKLYPTEDFL
ncbi:hypothetical protein BGW38_000386 [Lunasporangiospora selenospora]|uniref:Hemimethylated DNA-binding domain-containing protein n=1 Tax=Lunasporangiospora selenospora TaxID=979761 RepID=A0A9P6FVQ7_9FUNG|nr:hypothetical protein BGW38_000386 [Lunasporangiospora selenospora]